MHCETNKMPAIMMSQEFDTRPPPPLPSPIQVTMTRCSNRCIPFAHASQHMSPLSCPLGREPPSPIIPAEISSVLYAFPRAVDYHFSLCRVQSYLLLWHRWSNQQTGSVARDACVFCLSPGGLSLKQKCKMQHNISRKSTWKMQTNRDAMPLTAKKPPKKDA